MTQVVANGINIEYEQHGRRENESLILIRGLGTQLIDWPDSLIEGLVASGLHVVTFDNRDVGLSQKFDNFASSRAGAEPVEPVPAYDATDMAKDVIGLMDVLDIEKAHILGISMGGMIAQLVAAEYPGRVHSMISVMSSSSRRGLPGGTPAACQAMIASPDPDGGDEAIIALNAESMAVFGSPGYPESLTHRRRMATRQFERCYNPDGVARQMAAVIRSGDRTEKLKLITVPTTVIHGVDDPLIPIACGEDTAHSIPGSRMVAVPGMGHNIPQTLVMEFIGYIETHLTIARTSTGSEI